MSAVRPVRRASLPILLLLALGVGALAQGTMHRQAPQTDTTDSSGHVRTDNAVPPSDSALHGVVVVADGAAPETMVEVFSDCEGLRRVMAVTDTKGRFAIEGQLAGTLARENGCTLRASLDGYRSTARPAAELLGKSAKNAGELRLEPFSASAAGIGSAAGVPSEKGQVKAYRRAREDAARQDWQKGEAELRGVAAACPACASVWMALGILQQLAGNRTAAEESFAQAARADAAFAPPLIRSAVLASARGDWQAAGRLAGQAIALNPSAFPNAYALSARASMNLQKAGDAVKTATEGLKLDTTGQFPDLEYALGMALYTLNDEAAAKTHLEAYLGKAKNGPDASSARSILAEIHPAAGKVSAAATPAPSPRAGPEIVNAEFQRRNAPLLEKTPDHTCLESIALREFDNRGKPREGGVARVEIAVSNGDEIYQRAGDKRFGNERLSDILAENGFSNSGLFHSIARALVAGNDVAIELAGEETLHGEAVKRYHFRLVPGAPGWSIRYGKETGRAGEEGSFFVDSAGSVLRRVAVRAVDLPRNLRLNQLEAVIDYEPETLAGRAVLLPTNAVVRVEERNGTRRVSRLSFNHCRQFAAESALLASPDEQGPGERPAAMPLLPPGVEVTVALASPISPAAAAANDVIQASVAAPVSVGGRKIVEAGAAVEGHVRLRRDKNEVVIELDRVETRNGWAPFYAHLVAMTPDRRAPVSGANAAGRMPPGDGDEPDVDVPGVGRLQFAAGSAEAPAGTRMVWKTEALPASGETRAPQLNTAVAMH